MGKAQAVPSSLRCTPAQEEITSSKAVSTVTRKSGFLTVFPRLREIRSSSGKSTSLGSGDHHKMGWPSEYHGKMPRE
jgi:hypothetical protein